MPKMKSKSGAAKRFRATASGRFKCRHSFTSHILTKKSTKRKRQLRQPGMIAECDTPAVRKLLPYA
jgi:large subunit ribosomal protein L35